MTEKTLVDALRTAIDLSTAHKEAEQNMKKAFSAACKAWYGKDSPDANTNPDENKMRIYLRGHDDRQPEIDALQAELAAAREENDRRVNDITRLIAPVEVGGGVEQFLADRDRLAALQERVRELEATLLDEHSRLAQEEAQPAAVGVVGAVRYGVLCVPKNYAPSMNNAVYSTHESAYRAWAHESSVYRVVAIVDPDSIVPLASGDAVGWRDEYGELHHKRQVAVYNGVDTVAPLYPGLPQPAQVPSQEEG
jgi:hypothetical protein